MIEGEGMLKKILIAVVVGAALIATGLASWWLVQQYRPRPESQAASNPGSPRVLKVGYFAGDLRQLSPGAPEWKLAKPVEIPLTFQVLVIPWGKSDKGPITARALHNGKTLYLRLEWVDATENRRTVRIEDLADACALMFPLDATQPPSLMMGFLGTVNIWHWKANWDAQYWGHRSDSPASDDFYPFDDDPVFHPARAVGNLQAAASLPSAVEDLLSQGPGSITTKETQLVAGRGLWRAGHWQMVFGRALTTDGAHDFQFKPGSETRMAFAVWDGARGEKGSRKSISEWVTLALEPVTPVKTASAQRREP